MICFSQSIKSATTAGRSLLIMLAFSLPTSADVLFITAGNDKILTFDTRASSPTFSTFAATPAVPYGLGFNSQGELFVDSYYSTTIYKFSGSGTRTDFTTSLSLDTAHGMAVDSAGSVFVSLAEKAKILQITPDGTTSLFANLPGGSQGLAFDASGTLFAAVGQSIMRFTPGGVGTVFATGGMSNAYGLAFDHFGNLFVTSANNNKIFRFAPDGTGIEFASGGLLNSPAALALDSLGNIFVANTGDNLLLKYTPDGIGTRIGTVPGVPRFMAVQPVPEPSSLILTAAGIVATIPILMRRRRRSA